MPKISEINKDSVEGYIDNSFNGYIANHNETYEPLLDSIKAFNSKLDEIENQYNRITGLEEDSFKLDGDNPLYQLASNLKKDISTFSSDIEGKLEDAFRKEIRTHREREASYTLSAAQAKYKEKLLELQESINKYNIRRNSTNYNKETKEFEKYSKATSTTDVTTAPTVAYGSGKINIDLQQKYILPALKDAKIFYEVYIMRAQELKNKYNGTAKNPPNPYNMKSIGEEDKKALGWSSSSKTTDTTKNDNKDLPEINPFDRPDYKIVGHLYDDSGDFLLYASEEDGKCYVFDIEGNSHPAYFGTGYLTSEILEKQVGTKIGTITVKTGADFGKHNFDVTNEVELLDEEKLKKLLDKRNKINDLVINGDTYIPEKILENKNGKYVLYSKEDGGNKRYYIQDSHGNMNRAKLLGGPDYTDTNSTAKNTIKVETNTEHGDEHFSFSNSEIKDITSEDKNNFIVDKSVGTYNGYSVYTDKDDKAYIETYPGKYTPLTAKKLGVGNTPAVIKQNNNGVYEFDDDYYSVRIDTSYRKTQDIPIDTSKFKSN